MIKLTALLIYGLMLSAPATARETSMAVEQTKPTVVLLFTATGLEPGEDTEDLSQIPRFAFEEYDKENKTTTEVNLITVDDKDDPNVALQALKKVAAEQRPVSILGPIYSNVAMGLKDFINQNKIPLLSMFATHNDLTKGSDYIFRICASNRRLVKTMADLLIPEAQKEHLNIITFKDLNDDYSVDLVDTFRSNLTGIKIGYNEVLFKGLGGLERLQDINSKIWSPTKKDIIFVPTRDAIAGHVIAALESEPYMVASIDPVTFLKITKRIKKEKTHIRLVETAQWLPGKSPYSKKIEEEYLAKFHHPMTITTALTYDAAYTLAAALHKSLKKSITLVEAMRDLPKIQGVTGPIVLGRDGERIFSSQFLKEGFIE